MAHDRDQKSVTELLGLPDPPQDGPRSGWSRRPSSCSTGTGSGPSASTGCIAAAGVTKTTFYKHFEGKDDLMVAAVQRRDEWESQAWDRAVRKLAGDDPGRAVPGHARRDGRLVQRPGLPRVHVHEHRGRVPQPARPGPPGRRRAQAADARPLAATWPGPPARPRRRPRRSPTASRPWSRAPWSSARRTAATTPPAPSAPRSNSSSRPTCPTRLKEQGLRECTDAAGSMDRAGDGFLQPPDVDRLGRGGRRSRPRGSGGCRRPCRSRSGRSPGAGGAAVSRSRRISSKPLPSGRPMSLISRSNCPARGGVQRLGDRCRRVVDLVAQPAQEPRHHRSVSRLSSTSRICRGRSALDGGAPPQVAAAPAALPPPRSAQADGSSTRERRPRSRARGSSAVDRAAVQLDDAPGRSPAPAPARRTGG